MIEWLLRLPGNGGRVLTTRSVVDSAMSAASAEITVLLDGDTELCLPLAAAAALPFEDARPVRTFPSFRGQRNFPGLWWSATSGRHVGYESWLERGQAMLLDFDPRVVGLAAQPFWLSWRAGGRTHAPDFFARLDDGTGVLVDCRPEDRRPDQDAATFAITGRLCAEVGWQYRLVGAVDPVLAGNVRWLAGYRHPRYRDGDVAARLLELFARPAPLLAGASRAGDPIAVLPVLFHLLWQRRLDVTLTDPLHVDSLVSRPAG